MYRIKLPFMPKDHCAKKHSFRFAYIIFGSALDGCPVASTFLKLLSKSMENKGSTFAVSGSEIETFVQGSIMAPRITGFHEQADPRVAELFAQLVSSPETRFLYNDSGACLNEILYFRM